MAHKIYSLIAEWLSRSGDDTFWSWVITVTYLITFILSFSYVRKTERKSAERFFWYFITAFIFIMGLNKQLDVQILVIMIGRFCASHLGLMPYRHMLYFLVFLSVLIAMLTGIALLLIKAREVLLHSKLPLLGVMVLMLFILIRAGYVYVPHVHSIELLGLIFILSGVIGRIRNTA